MTHNSAAAEIIIHNDQRDLVTTEAYNLGVATTFVAETTTIQKGLLLALQRDIQYIYVESDNLLVINVVNNIWKAPWQIQLIIEDIQGFSWSLCCLSHSTHISGSKQGC